MRVVQKLCAGLDCPLHFCDEVISLDKSAMSTYSTARLSFVTPRHQRTATCHCEGTDRVVCTLTVGFICEGLLLKSLSGTLGGRCPVLNNLCENSPCPEGMECVADSRDAVYSCVCPEAKKGKCSGKNTHLVPLHPTLCLYRPLYLVFHLRCTEFCPCLS